MNSELTIADLDIILESFRYSKKAYSEYQDYPSNDFRREQIERVEQVERKIREIRSDLKKKDKTR